MFWGLVVAFIYFTFPDSSLYLILYESAPEPIQLKLALTSVIFETERSLATIWLPALVVNSIYSLYPDQLPLTNEFILTW